MHSIKQPKRILYVNGGRMDYGGISQFMMNYYRHMDRSRIQIDFAVHTGEGPLDGEIRQMGGRVFHLPDKKIHPGKYRKHIRRILQSGGYRIVHAHMNAMNGLFLLEAMLRGVPVRISHSHGSAFLTKNIVRQLPHRYARWVLRRTATHRFACSNAAGLFLYGEDSFEIIPNAIETERFAYSEASRIAIRQELGIEDEYIIGHIGHFEPVKNHRFLIDIYTEIVKKQVNTKLLLVGDGTLLDEIRITCGQRGISDHVIFAGQRTDVERIYSAMDCFVLPSMHEGFPMCIVEAQANGLPILLSDRVPADVCLTENVDRIALEDRSCWITGLLHRVNQGNGRNSEAQKQLREKGYDIHDAAKTMMDRYERIYEET